MSRNAENVREGTRSLGSARPKACKNSAQSFAVVRAQGGGFAEPWVLNGTPSDFATRSYGSAMGQGLIGEVGIRPITNHSSQRSRRSPTSPSSSETPVALSDGPVFAFYSAG